MLRRVTDLAFRLRALFRRGTAERELHDELAFHLQMDAETLRAGGLASADADREARRRFGSLTRESERVREGWGVGLGFEFLADVRHAVRQMRRRPAFSAIAVLTLGLGIGATVALFSVVNGLLLRPLPYPDEDRVQVFWMDYDWRGEEYDFVRERPGVFQSIAAFSTDGAPYRVSARAPGGAELLSYVVATSTLFDVLGTRPLLGRAFTAEDDRPGAPPVLVISYGMWRQDLAGDPDVIGHQVLLNGQPATVVGVMPQGFFFPSPEIRAWRPIQLDPSSAFYRNVGYLTLVARTRAGVSPDLVARDVQRIARALGERFTYPDAWDKTKNASATSARVYLLGSVHDPLLLLLGAVGLLLLIACANTAALILARTSDRTGEMAVRAALGAGHARLARQIVAESLVLAVCAAAVGAIIAATGFRVLVASLPLQDGFGKTVTPGWVAFGTAFALALGIAGAVSIAPVRNLLHGRFDAGLGRERSEEGLRRGTRRVHSAIIAGQVTLAVLLVVGATLLIRSVERIQALDPGFDARGVATFSLIAGSQTAVASQRQFFRDVVTRVSALPGVTASGLINRLPVRDGGYQGPVSVEGRADLEGPKRPNSLYRTVTPDFFRAMGMQIREGRGIDSTDLAHTLPVTVISESFAHRMWPGQSALGRHISTGYSGTPVARTVVGVARETRMTNMIGEVPFVMFVPFAQHDANVQEAALVVRTRASLPALMTAVRRAIAELNPDVAVSRVGTMEEVVATSLAQPLRLRFFLSLFAALALVLGTVGVYGVVSYAVARRRAEFGIRIALGASPSRVLGEVIRHGLAPVALGVAGGLAGALALARVLGGFLYGVAPTDVTSLLTAGGVLLLAGTLAALVPAVRAGRTSPVVALRAD
jgi:putative ABC transport system permease protein